MTLQIKRSWWLDTILAAALLCIGVLAYVASSGAASTSKQLSKPSSSAQTLLDALDKQVKAPQVYGDDDPQLQHTWHNFDGQWMPSVEPSRLGPDNYTTLQNIRYGRSGLEGIQGWTRLTTSPINSEYMIPMSGFHYRKDRPAESHIIVQAYNTAMTRSKLYGNETTIPEAGNFTSTAIHTDLAYADTVVSSQDQGWKDWTNSGPTPISRWQDRSGVAVWQSLTGSAQYVYTDRARFSHGPMGTLLYNNGAESMIWEGDEAQPAAFLTATSQVTEYVTGAKDFTREITNTVQTTAESADIKGNQYFLVGSTRRISGAKFYVLPGYTGSGTIGVSQWVGTSGWQTAGGISDGTNGLSQTGTVSWTNTDISEQKYLSSRLIYWYQFHYYGGASSGASIYNISTVCPLQELGDVWDGTYRQPISFQAHRHNAWHDYTLEVNTSSSEISPIAAELGGMTSTGEDGIIVIFEDRIRAMKLDVISGNTQIVKPNIYTWNGSSWALSGITYDGTATITGVSTLYQSDVMAWEPPPYEQEFRQTLFGVEGYAYKITFTGTLGTGSSEDSAASTVLLDRVLGIPAAAKLYPYKFPGIYKDRVLQCGFLKGNEGNRIDYSMTNAPDVWNGSESSDGGRNSLYFGGNQELTATAELYNRVGSNLYTMLVVFKANEMYQMTENSDGDFVIDTVTLRIGCPSPFSVTPVEMGYEVVSEEVRRNVVLFLSSEGPYSYDGAVLAPIPGLEAYFDYSDPLYVGQTSIKDAIAWIEGTRMEWNVIIGNKWVVYDLTHRKWYEKVPPSYPKCVVPVTDTYGNRYVYAGLSTGHFVRLDYGNTWDGTAITQVVETGDFLPSGDAWHETRIRKVKLAHSVTTEAAALTIQHTSNTEASGVTTIGSGLLLSTGSSQGRRVNRQTIPVNRQGWHHRFKFTASTSSTTKGFQPIGWGYQFGVIREDE